MTRDSKQTPSSSIETSPTQGRSPSPCTCTASFVQQLRSFCRATAQLSLTGLAEADREGLRTDLQDLLARLDERPSPAEPKETTPAIAQPATQPQEARRTEGCPPRVLVVDDERVARTVLKRMLALSNIECSMAEGGQEALDVLAGERFDVIFLDLEMPDIDGLQVATQLSQHPERADFLVVGVSSSEMHDVREQALNAGMDEYIAKPATKAKLAHVFEQWQSRAA